MDAIDDLRHPAKKFYYNSVMDSKRKIELLNKLLDAMDKTGKDIIPDFNIDSRSMHTKKYLYTHITTIMLVKTVNTEKMHTTILHTPCHTRKRFTIKHRHEIQDEQTRISRGLQNGRTYIGTTKQNT